MDGVNPASESWRGRRLAVGVVLAFGLALQTSCQRSRTGDSGSAGTPGGDVVAPTFLQAPTLTLNPSGHAPLAVLLTAETDEVSRLSIEIDNGRRTFYSSPPTLASLHAVPLIGFLAGTTHTLRITAEDLAGNQTTAVVVLATPALPADFPQIQVDAAVPDQMEPGVTLFAGRFGTATQTGGYIFFLNDLGEVVWYYQNDDWSPGDAELLRNGNLLFLHGGSLVEIDVLGTFVQQWFPTGPLAIQPQPHAITVDVDYFHHEAYELPEGEDADFLVLSSEFRFFPDYPIDPLDLSRTSPNGAVVGDKIVEFRRDGTIVRELSLLDVLDPYRITYSSLGGFWNTLYGRVTYDWSHANAVVIDPRDDTYVVSLRHQDAVVKIERDTGRLVWILGNALRWAPSWQPFLFQSTSPTFEWPFGQHAPEYSADGLLVLFDNGNYRATPPDPPLDPSLLYSRAVAYRLDESRLQLSEEWAYGGPSDPWYSSAVGDADPLPSTGNVLITDGFRKVGLRRWGRILEVSREDPARVLFEVRLDEPTRSWTIYRAERISAYASK